MSVARRWRASSAVRLLPGWEAMPVTATGDAVVVGEALMSTMEMPVLVARPGEGITRTVSVIRVIVAGDHS